MGHVAEPERLLLVSGSSYTQKNLASQLRGFLPEHVEIVPYLTDEENLSVRGSFFAVFSSRETYQEFMDLGLPIEITSFIIGTRTILNDNLEKVLSLPRDQVILLAADSEISAMNSIRHLQDIGFDFLHMVPCYPGGPDVSADIKIAITPGDPEQVPPSVKEVYNIGTRPFDFATVVKIMAHYHVLEEKVQDYADGYLSRILQYARQISNAADEAAKVMKTVRTQLIGKGYYAKYHFSDIIGETPEIQKAREISEKIARTELSVLIEGDNGTGKELFASAIHNASSRSKQPFIAINVSALPDQLVDSELFGYEEGAFTGAKKGGKIGLLQQAAGGTIFLDEIGDISLGVQAKLLRVLQEREIMKLGGDRIIPVDVRIIAATNRDLQQMISEKTFRKDLYYRLKEGYIRLPSLAERKADIPLLLQHWQKKAFFSSKEIRSDAMEILTAHDWPGNIRELLNTMKYAMAVCEGDTITRDDLPFEPPAPQPVQSRPSAQSGSADSSAQTLLSRKASIAAMEIDQMSLAVLLAIHEINQMRQIAGRNRIYWYLKENGYAFSEYKIRQCIAALTTQGLVISPPGRYGLSLTDKGQDLFKNHCLVHFA